MDPVTPQQIHPTVGNMAPRFYGLHFQDQIDHIESNDLISNWYAGSEPFSGDGARKRVHEHVGVGSYSGDGVSSAHGDYLRRVRTPSMDDVGRPEGLSVSVRPANLIDLPFAPRLTKPTPSSEAWKLVLLVFAFAVWISTAGTLLFFYMDRYLFG